MPAAEVISLHRGRAGWQGTREPSNYWGFVLFDEAKAFFTAVENFAQLQDSESSPQRVVFNLSTTCFPAVGGKAVGVNTIGGPTG